MKRKKKNYLTAYIVMVYIIIYSAYAGYRIFYLEKVDVCQKTSLYIPSNSTVEEVVDSLLSAKIIKSSEKFLKHIRLSEYSTIKSGHYVVPKNMTYRNLIKMLCLGQQTPINMVVSGAIRTKYRLAGILAKQIEADSVSLLHAFDDSVFLKDLGFTSYNSILLFMPNTYNVYWNRDVKQLFKDMKKEHDKYWTSSRLEKLKSLGLTKDEVMILASLIVEESSKYDEYPNIAGVYMNRLRKKMPLQADPTVKYALNDFSIRRVLTVHTEVDSPYNTYKHSGLPPGPICIPDKKAVDAVLNYSQHEYLYFCAKADFSGYHVFAKTLQQHNQNANAYRNALNHRKIF
ncbi:MAG: endolytic transglycosylase MltG [Prevotellaceae bacterium]|nr:endolytic transglycosylase MltG [Prevotellaceae bacterium]